MAKFIDSKLKRVAPKRMNKNMEYGYMETHSNEKASDKFNAEPYQLKYKREHGTQGTEQ